MIDAKQLNIVNWFVVGSENAHLYCISDMTKPLYKRRELLPKYELGSVL